MPVPPVVDTTPVAEGEETAESAAAVSVLPPTLPELTLRPLVLLVLALVVEGHARVRPR